MSPEKLILKYIDGELSSSEDELLRKMIREDEDSKELFDSYVELHSSMQEDAKSISVPQSLFDETEDLVMMKILEEEPSYAAPVNQVIAESKLSKYLARLSFMNFNLFANGLQLRPFFASVALILMIFGVGIISDGKLPKIPISQVLKSTEASEISSLKESNILVLDNTQNTAKSIKKPIEKTKVQAINAATSNINSKVAQIESLQSNASSTENSNVIMSDNESESNEMPKNSKISSDEKLFNAIDVIDLPQNSVPNSQVANFNNNIVSDMLALNSPESPLNFNQVQLTSFVGQDYFRQGINSADGKSISNYSQSISYSASEANRFGLEFGYMEYEMYNEVYLSLPNQVLVLMPNDLGINAGPIMTKVPVRLFFGSAFYERTLFSYSGFSLNGRIGAGASSGGPMAYLRLFAKQKIISGIYITVGSEGKVFRTDHPLFEDKFNSIGTFMYGLQFAF